MFATYASYPKRAIVTPELEHKNNLQAAPGEPSNAPSRGSAYPKDD
jgi:hypothetical protein